MNLETFWTRATGDFERDDQKGQADMLLLVEDVFKFKF